MPFAATKANEIIRLNMLHRAGTEMADFVKWTCAHGVGVAG